MTDMTNKAATWIINRMNRTRAWEFFFKRLNIYNVRFKGYPAFKMSDYFRIIDRSIPDENYVFLSTDSKSLGSIAVKKAIRNSKHPVYFSHAGLLFFNGDRNTSIMHVTSAGLIEQLLIDFLKQVDYFCVIRIPAKPENQTDINERIQHFRNIAHLIKYDWEEQLDNDPNLIYCSELVYDVYKDLVISPNLKPRKILGRYVFDPNILMDCGEIIYCDHPEVIERSVYKDLQNSEIQLTPDFI